MLTGWGRTAPTRATVHEPRRHATVASLMQQAGPRGLIARGLGRSYGDPAQNAGGDVLSMTALAGVHEFDPVSGVVTVDAGLSIDALLGLLVPAGRFMSVVPGTANVTVGGALASDIHGKNHHRDGSFGEHVISFVLQTPAGERLTVDRDSLPEVFDATVGGMGLTGVVLEATLRSIPIDSTSMRVDIERAADLDDAMARMTSRDEAYRYSVAWIDCLAGGARLGRSVLLRGDHARREDLDDRQGCGLDWPAPVRVSAPPWVPNGLLSAPGMRAFNELWFRRAPREPRDRLESMRSFFFPLDAITSWNRLYGGRGFVQYQLVVPLGQERAVRTVLEQLGSRGCPSFLGVLKRFGRQRGILSFAMEGWTLALDIPARVPNLHSLLDDMDVLVAEAGGRVYLAKDARMKPEVVKAMYPRLDEWRELRARLDPGSVMQSDLSRRLELTEPRA